mmetsp:Transcript_73292/g.238458  ORF Transcript_73292/g.238458 Transcript_73292/m.238458 type:complete len:368 (-) Transcript_73292:3991-5094(-)
MGDLRGAWCDGQASRARLTGAGCVRGPHSLLQEQGGGEQLVEHDAVRGRPVSGACELLREPPRAGLFRSRCAGHRRRGRRPLHGAGAALRWPPHAREIEVRHVQHHLEVHREGDSHPGAARHRCGPRLLDALHARRQQGLQGLLCRASTSHLANQGHDPDGLRTWGYAGRVPLAFVCVEVRAGVVGAFGGLGVPFVLCLLRCLHAIVRRHLATALCLPLLGLLVRGSERSELVQARGHNEEACQARAHRFGLRRVAALQGAVDGLPVGLGGQGLHFELLCAALRPLPRHRDLRGGGVLLVGPVQPAQLDDPMACAGVRSHHAFLGAALHPVPEHELALKGIGAGAGGRGQRRQELPPSGGARSRTTG